MSFRRRDIFLAIRGVDQTGRAFSTVDRRIENLIQKQMKLQGVTRKVAKQMVADQIAIINKLDALGAASYRLLFAGAAFTMFAGAIAYGIGKIVGASSMGQLYVEDFNRALERLMIALSEAIIEQWGPAIQGFITWLDDLSKNETFKQIVSGVAIPITLVLGLMGVSLLVTGILGKFLAMIVSTLVTAGFISAGTAATITAGVISLAIPAVVVISAVLWWEFAVAEESKEVFNAWIKERDRLILEEGYMPWEADIESMMNLPEVTNPDRKGPPKYRQLGTTRIARTGPIIAHEGEWIFNPQLPISTPPQMLGKGAGGPISISITQIIDSIGVEADEERLAEKTAEYIGDKIADVIG